MKFADQSAKRLNHEYIGTEHVLLGLLEEGKDVAAQVLHNFNIDLHGARTSIRTFLLPGPKRFWLPRRDLTPRTIRAIEKAREESRLLGHNYIGTEHLLLGLIDDSEGLATHILADLGASPAIIRDEVLKLKL